MSDILLAMKSGDHRSAAEACDLLQENKKMGRHTALARLRIMALWISKNAPAMTAMESDMPIKWLEG